MEEMKNIWENGGWDSFDGMDVFHFLVLV